MTQVESVLAYFQQHPGDPIAIEVLTVGVNRLRQEQGLEPMTEQQIKWTINSLRHRNEADIEIITPGRMWRMESMEDMGYVDNSEPEEQGDILLAMAEQPEEVEKVWCPEPGVIFRWNLLEHKLYRVTVTEIQL
jgi:hypothetical protein